MRRNRRALFSGLGPGTAIEARDLHGARRGAVACILARATDPGTPTHLLTAGHLFDPRATDTALFAASSSNAPHPVQIGQLALNLLVPHAGRLALDAALVQLSEGGAAMCRTSAPCARLMGTVHPDLLRAQSVQARFAVRGMWSKPGVTHVRVEPARMHARLWRNGYDVQNVVGVAGLALWPGDSGTALCGDELAPATPQQPAERLLLGVCIGQLATAGLFQPAYPVIELLQTLQFNLELWNP